MSLYRRSSNSNWQMSMTIGLVIINRSTRTTDKARAQAIEAKAKELLRRELQRDKADRRAVDEVIAAAFSTEVTTEAAPMIRQDPQPMTPQRHHLMLGYDSEEEKAYLVGAPLPGHPPLASSF